MWNGGRTPLAAGGGGSGTGLLAVSPNPSQAPVTLHYEVARSGRVEVELFDLAGRRVRRLVGEAQPAGRHRVVWDGRDAAGGRVAEGVYFCRMSAGSYRATHRLVLMK
jgi:flagellar hook assembly protein FlgD